MTRFSRIFSNITERPQADDSNRRLKNNYTEVEAVNNWKCSNLRRKNRWSAEVICNEYHKSTAIGRYISVHFERNIFNFVNIDKESRG